MVRARTTEQFGDRNRQLPNKADKLRLANDLANCPPEGDSAGYLAEVAHIRLLRP